VNPEAENARRRMTRFFLWSGVATIFLAVVLGALVWTPLFAIAAFAGVDFLLAWAYSTGRVKVAGGGGAPPPQEQPDPSYNPYARED
jgi:Flp pilus assembly protein TadB